MMDIHQILKQLPHRYPILLVDRVLEKNAASLKQLHALRDRLKAVEKQLADASTPKPSKSPKAPKASREEKS